MPELINEYLAARNGAPIDAATLASYASLQAVHAVSPGIAKGIINELGDQRQNLKLIASENYSSLEVQLAHGNWFTDKYAEGYPGHRFYAGCENVDDVESEAAQLAQELFGAEHAFVQPHSGADANLVAFLAVLNARVQRPATAALGATDPSKLTPADWAKVRDEVHGARLLSLDYYSGGHLTHGYRHNVSALLFDVHTYSVSRETGLIDLDALRAQVHEVRPLVLLAGYSAYPRKIDFAKMREMADEVGAVFVVDMAHFAGLVAGKVFSGSSNPVEQAAIVTSTTHKTLRGPRGGLVLTNGEFAEHVDRGCPMILGGPLPHAMAAKAVAFREALRPEFAGYAQRIVHNARTLAECWVSEGVSVLTGGTDNHLILMDVAKSYGLTGRQAESALRECHVTLNRNSLPFDANGPWYTSGLRFGTPAVTTLGMGTDEIREIGRITTGVLRGVTSAPGSKAKYTLDPAAKDEAQQRVRDLLSRYPVYPTLDLELMRRCLPG
jgi:glycine hydroxymethyltransferase